MNCKIGIVQLGDPNYYKFRQNSVQTVKHFCSLHGYDHIVYTDDIDNSIHTAWNKPLALKNHMNDYDYIAWIDMDCVITNYEFDLEQYLNAREDILIARDPMYIRDELLNTGVLFFRVNEFSRKVINIWWEIRTKDKNSPWRINGGDQGPFNLICKKYNIVGQNPHDFNIHPNHFVSGDFICHFMGTHPNQFEDHARYALDHIKENSILTKYWWLVSKACLSWQETKYEGIEDKYTDPRKCHEIAKILAYQDVPQ